MKPQSVLFVCIGNICRSPMALCLFQAQKANFDSNSAGLAALSGSAADKYAQESLENLYQLQLNDHVAKQLNAELIQKYDLILSMSFNQVHQIQHLWPTARGKAFRLGHWRGVNISDPYGKSKDEFDACCTLIHACVNDWINHLN